MVTISPRFNGPAHTGNGGYVSGLVATQCTAIPGPVRVTLTLPPPLGTPLAWEAHGDGVRLETHGGAVVGTGEPAAFDRGVPAWPDADEVTRGVAAYDGFVDHPFATCFSCGTEREPGDGLRVFPGIVDDRRSAATWEVLDGHAEHGTVPVPVVWAAMDCAGGWASGMAGRQMVLGRMTAEVLAVPSVGDTCHVVGELAESQGRKHFASTALYTATGDLLARAEQVWFVIDPVDFA